MGWNHVQGSGAQASSGSNHTLTATFSGAVAAGDLIVRLGGMVCRGLGNADCRRQRERDQLHLPGSHSCNRLRIISGHGST